MNLIYKNKIVLYTFIVFLLFFSTADFLSFEMAGRSIRFSYIMTIIAFVGWFFINPWNLFVEIKSILRCFRTRSQLQKALNLSMLLFFVILIISTCYSFDYLRSAVWISWLIFNLFSGFLVYSIFAKGNFSEEDIVNIFAIVLFLTLIPAFVQKLFDIVGYLPPFIAQMYYGKIRINGLTLFPNFYAVHLSLFLPFLLYGAAFFRRKRYYFLIFLTGIVLSWTTSRSSLVIPVSVIFLFCILCIRSIKKIIFAIVLLCASYLPMIYINELISTKIDKLHVSSFMYNSSIYETSIRALEMNLNGSIEANLNGGIPNYLRGDEFLWEMTNFNSNGIAHRTQIAKQAFVVLKENLFWGTGAGAYSKWVLLHSEVIPKIIYSRFSIKPFSHHESIWTELMTEIGLFGALAFLLAITSTFLIMFKRAEKSPLVVSSLSSLIAYYAVSGNIVQNPLLTSVYLIWGVAIFLAFGSKLKSF